MSRRRRWGSQCARHTEAWNSLSALVPWRQRIGIERGLEAGLHHMWKVRQNLEVELAPYQFAQPDRRAGAAGYRGLQGGGCQAANRDLRISNASHEHSITTGSKQYYFTHSILKQD